MISPSTRAEAVNRTFMPRTRPTIRPFTITSSAVSSPLIVAVSPIVKRCALISPSTVPSTCISPVVLMFPVICKSEDKIEAGGFAFGADGLKSCDCDDAVLLGTAPAAAAAPSSDWVGSLILLLENIFCCLDISHRVYGLSTLAHLIVKMRSSGVSTTTHITYPVATRDPLAFLDADF